MREITVQELAARLERGEHVALLDVREPWEHALVALAGSRLVPLGTLADRIDEAAPAPGVPVVVYCHHGVRSLAGARLLAERGVSDVVSLRGGIDAWSREIDARVPRY